MDNVPNIGNDNYGWSGCNDTCGTENFRYLHQRYVFRIGNVVVVLYTWGLTRENSSSVLTNLFRDRFAPLAMPLSLP